MKRRQAVLSVSAAALMITLVFCSAQAKQAAAEALQLCGTTLIPSLFPFYAASNLMLSAGIPQPGNAVSTLMERLFHLPAEAAPALLLGLLGGYPLGASASADLYWNGVLTESEAIRLSSFANNAGPAFIIGAAGLAVFGSVGAGLLLYLIHAVSAILTGLLLRGNEKAVIEKRRCVQNEARPVSQLLTKGISSAAGSMLSICAFVVFFSVVCTLFFLIPPVRLLTGRIAVFVPSAKALISGTLELSGGIIALQEVPKAAAFIAASFLLGFGGVCVLCQTASVLNAAGLPSRHCLCAKLIHGTLSALIACCFCALTAFRVSLFPVVFLFSCVLFIILKIRGRKTHHHLL